MEGRQDTGIKEVVHATCAICARTVVLDPAATKPISSTSAELSCPACGSPIHVPQEDVARAAPQGIWGIASYAGSCEEPKAKTTGFARLFQRHAS